MMNFISFVMAGFAMGVTATAGWLILNTPRNRREDDAPLYTAQLITDAMDIDDVAVQAAMEMLRSGRSDEGRTIACAAYDLAIALHRKSACVNNEPPLPANQDWKNGGDQ